MRKIILLIAMMLMVSTSFAGVEYVDSLSGTVYQEYLLTWSYPDTCAMNEIVAFAILSGKHTWDDTLTGIRFSDTSIVMLSKAPLDTHVCGSDTTIVDTTIVDRISVFIEMDSTYKYGGFQYFFTICGIDSSWQFSAHSDTAVLIFPFLADVDCRDAFEDTTCAYISKVNIFDHITFEEAYLQTVSVSPYNKIFRIFKPKRQDNKIRVYIKDKGCATCK